MPLARGSSALLSVLCISVFPFVYFESFSCNLGSTNILMMEVYASSDNLNETIGKGNRDYHSLPCHLVLDLYNSNIPRHQCLYLQYSYLQNLLQLPCYLPKLLQQLRPKWNNLYLASFPVALVKGLFKKKKFGLSYIGYPKSFIRIEMLNKYVLIGPDNKIAVGPSSTK